MNHQSTHHSPLRGVGIGAGYFSHYQYDSWRRLPDVTITGIYNRTQAKADALMAEFGIPRAYATWQALIDQEEPDFVDIITPPETHLEMCRYAAARNVTIICQKPLAPTYRESQQIVEAVNAAGARFMVHENFRWQPWYREIKRLIDHDELGEVTSIYFRMRPGDGWGEDAYLARQPFFRSYPRLLVYETGVHFIDTFRFLLGEIDSVYARLRRLNPVIQGEDSGQFFFGYPGGAAAILDANRFNEMEAADPRLTFGELRIDGSKGHLILDTDGQLWRKPLGQSTRRHEYAFEKRGFAGDCVHRLQSHFVAQMRSGEPFESTGDDYLKTVKVVEACYASAATGEVIHLDRWEPEG